MRPTSPCTRKARAGSITQVISVMICVGAITAYVQLGARQKDTAASARSARATCRHEGAGEEERASLGGEGRDGCRAGAG